VKNTVVETVTGPSDDETNPVYPYEKIRAIVGDGGNWKWPRMWQKFDELERRGTAYREGEIINFEQPNKNPNIIPMKVVVVGGGPVGIRLAIELKLGGHQVSIFEKRREVRDEDGTLVQLGFTNRINRPHMWNYVRNDLEKLNGRDLMSREACYPVFTEPDTSSIGIDELQCLLLKNALMMGIDIRLGVGFVNAKVEVDKKSCRPRWLIESSYDKAAAEQFGVEEGTNYELFDALIGCDGPRSTVRETQQKYFGNIEKRKFMDCVGIVANVQKLKRKRLIELGFEHGQGPHDMNRTKMVFGPFFEKIKKEANADLENFIYYKASHHNYVIITPKRQSLVENNLSGKVYHFAVGRSGAGKQDEKAKLKEFSTKVLKAAGIPLDDQLSNGGFVEPPNDCMAFDFAECWSMKKSINFNVPPPDYDTEQHGEWFGQRLAPFIALAGDALLEPFWPMGLGLKRGWQAIMDACYALDNIYNRTLLCEQIGKDPNSCSWDDHWEALNSQITENFECCARVKVAEELGKGEYADGGMVMLHLRKKSKDATKPTFLVEIDPWTRYGDLEKARNSQYKRKAIDDPDWVHPVVSKALAMTEYNKTVAMDTSKNGEKKLLTIDGKEVKTSGGYTFKPPADTAPRKTIVFNAGEVAEASQVKRERLHRQVTEQQIDSHVEKAVLANRIAAQAQAMQKRQDMMGRSEEEMHELAHVAPADESILARTEKMWDRMHEKNLSAAQQAELDHIRNMIAALTKSLQSYREAEKQLLM